MEISINPAIYFRFLNYNIKIILLCVFNNICNGFAS